MEDNGFPSRTSILTAAARAFGSREPDASVRNPDWVADRLIGAAELALIADHPLSKALDQDFQEAMNDPDVFGFTWLMLVRTRFIDEMMERALRSGATQLVILGAGFDTRAHRFAELLRDVPVIEIDYGTTQEYKKRRVEVVLGGTPGNVVYAPIDFARESLGEVLRRAGFEPDRKTYYICEGVSMYVPEEGMKETLRAIAAESAPGSVLLMEYLNRDGLEMLKKYPHEDDQECLRLGRAVRVRRARWTGPRVFPRRRFGTGRDAEDRQPRISEAIRHAPGWELLRRASGESVRAAARNRSEGDG